MRSDGLPSYDEVKQFYKDALIPESNPLRFLRYYEACWQSGWF